MFGIPKEELDKLRTDYPVGTRVVLKKMDDARSPEIGSKGTVTGVDDIGTIHVRWDNHRCLGVVYGEDEVTKEAANG